MISRAGLSLPVWKFWAASICSGVILALLPLIMGLPWYLGVLTGVIGFLGLPRWMLSSRASRRQKAFIEGLPDAIDVIVRGLKAGLPISDAMRVIAAEASAPIGPEFQEIVEGQRVGITLDQGLERMFERIPLPEVSFLGIVINIQSKTGGNLSEALGNLSRVLRERKKMKAKVRAVSQEAKSSAVIIGALPFLIIAGLTFISPDYIEPLFTTSTGHIILACIGVWMGIGILVMRQMVNFEI
jgi:tight adherence protein B